MLKLYNKEHVAISALTNLKDYKIEYVLSGEDLLEFSLSIADENIYLVEEEGYIRNKNNEYVIKAIDPTQGFKRYSCVVNIEDIKGKSISNFDTSNNNITDTIRLAIAGTGWVLADNNISKRRTVRLKNTNALEVLREIRKVFRVDFRFDAINKIIYIYDQFGEDKGVYFSDELNLKSFSMPSDTYDYKTRIYPYGKDGLSISSINDGKEYIENYQYSNKVIEYIWEDGRYTDVNSLKEDAEAKLEELSKPKRSYQAEIIDLAKQSKEYEFLDFFLGDTITLLSKQEKFRDKQRIVKYIEYPNELYNNTCELGNTTLTFEELQKENEYRNKVVDNVTTGNGIVNGESIDSIKTEQISDFKASVAEITDLTAINIKVSNLEAQNVTITGKLNAIEGEFGTIKANVGVIDKLTVTHTAQINALEANKANITQLEAVSAIIGTLEATVGKIEILVNGNLSSENIQSGGITSDKLTISNGFIKNAMIDSLDVSKINAGIISTEKFQIRSNDGSMEFIGSTQQFKDKNNKIRIQLGKDAAGNFNFIIREEDGTTTLIDHTGVKAKAIADNLIVGNMIAQDAVGEKQINYSSFVSGFNKDTNTSTIKSSKVNIDLLNQTLDIAFNSLKTQADGTKSLTESHSTIISTMQGQITTAINNTKIEKDGQTILLKDDYNRTVQTVNSMNSTIGSHTTSINEHTGKITGVETRVNTVERDLNSITQRVSSTETNITAVGDKIDNLQIGGRNILLDTQFSDKSKWTSFSGDVVEGYLGKKAFTRSTTAASGGMVDFLQQHIHLEGDKSRQLKPNTWYTFSFYLKGIGMIATYVYPGIIDTGIKGFVDGVEKYLGNDANCSWTLTDTWTRHTVIFKTKSIITGNHHALFRLLKGDISVYVCMPQLEEGNKVSDYTEAPEDIQSQINAHTTEISTTKTKVATIETNLSGITSRVTNVESAQTTVNGKVISLETWKKSAEQKITDVSIISTVSSQFYKKGETDARYTSQTQFTQTVSDFEFKATQNGANNIIYNSKWINKLNNWYLTNATVEYYDIWFTEKGTGIGIKPIDIYSPGQISSDYFDITQNTDYALSIAYQVDANSKGLSVYLEQFDENGNWITGSPIFVNNTTSYQNGTGFFVRTSSDSRVKKGQIVIKNMGATTTYNNSIWIAWVKLAKGKVTSKWSPNPNELLNNIIVIDNDGILVKQEAGTFTRINNKEFYQANERGERTISMRYGGNRFYKWEHNKSYLGGTSAVRIGSADNYGISMFGTLNSNFVDLGMTDNSADGQSTNIAPWIRLSRLDDAIIINKNFRLNAEIEMNNHNINDVNTIRTKYAYGNLFGANDKLVVGGQMTQIGVAQGAGITDSFLLTDSTNLHTKFHQNFNNYSLLNCNLVKSLDAQSPQLRTKIKNIKDIFGCMSYTDGEVRYTDRKEYLITDNMDGSRSIMIEIPQIIAENIELDYHVSISKLSWGDYKIVEKNPYYFIIASNVDNFKFTFEIVAKLIEKPAVFSIIANKQYEITEIPKDEKLKNKSNEEFIITSSKYTMLDDEEIEKLIKIDRIKREIAS